MLTVLRDLLRYNREFAAGAALMAFVLIISGLSFFSPYSPQDIYLVPPDVPPS
jgi:peptide/nickel transport system permease protein